MPKPETKLYICTSCHHEQQSALKPCEQCGGRKLEHVDFKRQQLGEHWREMLVAEKGKVH